MIAQLRLKKSVAVFSSERSEVLAKPNRFHDLLKVASIKSKEKNTNAKNIHSMHTQLPQSIGENEKNCKD